MGKIKKTISKSVIKLLDPVVHLLLRYEISHSEFVELAKRSYVATARKYFSLPKRKQTDSRVSVITGLSRKEVARIGDLEADVEPATKGPLNRATRVIAGWLSDTDYLDNNNHQPKILPLRDHDTSFETLVSRYGGGITARAVLDELVRVGAVERLDKDNVKLTHRGFIPENDDSEKVEVFTNHATDLLKTGLHNLIEKEQVPRFQRQVMYLDMPETIVREFEQLSHEKSLVLLLELNQWLAEKKKDIKAGDDEARSRIGLGIYYLKDENQED